MIDFNWDHVEIIFNDEEYFTLSAESFDGTPWDSDRVTIFQNWSVQGDAIIEGTLYSLSTSFTQNKKSFSQKLYCFGEYVLPKKEYSGLWTNTSALKKLDSEISSALDFNIELSNISDEFIISVHSENGFPKKF